MAKSEGILGRLKVLLGLDNSQYKTKMSESKQIANNTVKDISNSMGRVKAPEVDTSKFKQGVDRLKQIAKEASEKIKVTFKTTVIPTTASATAPTTSVGGGIPAEIGSMNALIQKQRELNLEIRKLDASSQSYRDMAQDLARATNQINGLKNEQRQLTREFGVSNNSIAQMRLKVSELKAEWVNLDQVIDKIRFSEVKKELNSVTAALNKAEQEVGIFSRNIGNYRSGFDGLGFSIAQLTREAPAFAVSVGTGFLALSNNIPILGDEIHRLRIRNKALNAEGIKTPSIFKSIAGAFFSWHTLMSVGVTLLTLYGDKIVDWIGKLFQGESALKQIKEANDEFVESLRDGTTEAQGEIAKLDILKRTTENYTTSIEDRKRALAELRKLYPSQFKNLTDEQMMLGKVGDAYTNLEGKLMDQVKAKAQLAEAQSLKVSLNGAEEGLDSENKAQLVYIENLKKGEKLLLEAQKLRDAPGAKNTVDLQNEVVGRLKSNSVLDGYIKEGEKAIEIRLIIIEDLRVNYEAAISKINTSDILPDDTGVESTTKSFAELHKENDKNIKSLKTQQKEHGNTIGYLEKELSLFKEKEKYIADPKTLQTLIAENNERQRAIDIMRGAEDIWYTEEDELAKPKIETPTLEAFTIDFGEEIEIKIIDIFPTDSLADFDQRIQELTSNMQLLTGAELENAQSKLELLGMQRSLANNESSGAMEKEMTILARLTEAYHNAKDKAKELALTQLQVQEGVVASLLASEQQIEQMNRLIESGVENLVGGISEAIGGAIAGNDQSWEMLLSPVADMMIQLGQLAIAGAITMEAIKKMFSNPWTAIAAGVALIALGVAIKGSLSNIQKGGSGDLASSNNTFTGGAQGGYSNAGAITSDQLKGSQDINISGTLTGSGKDLKAVIDNTDKYNSR